MKQPTPSEVRKAKKAELVAWCKGFHLDEEGTVAELRTRILGYLEAGVGKEEEEAGVEAGEEARPLRKHVETVTEEGEPEPAEEPEPEPSAPAEPAEEAEVEEKREPEAVDTEGEAEEEKVKAKGKAVHTPKIRPKLDARVQQAMKLRREISSRRPAFRAQEWFRYKRLGESWRNPKGMHSKIHRHFGYRPNVVSIGYRGPKAARGLHPSGFREVLVHNTRELERIDPKVEAARIATTVGMRKRLEIQAAADERGVRVLNRRGEE